jgi:hypothetical protein
LLFDTPIFQAQDLGFKLPYALKLRRVRLACFDGIGRSGSPANGDGLSAFVDMNVLHRTTDRSGSRVTDTPAPAFAAPLQPSHMRFRWVINDFESRTLVISARF